VPLRFNDAWRFKPPVDGEFRNERIPEGAVDAFHSLIVKTATQGNKQEILEHFKAHFCAAVGREYVWSSNSSWAASDLRDCMVEASENAPVFLEAFFDACETLRQRNPQYVVPDAIWINKMCLKHQIGYEIRPPDLVLRDAHLPLVCVPERPPTLAERAVEVYRASLQRSEELLTEGKGREAVQELLWLLETVSTAFRGLETRYGRVEGKYFNQIVRDLRRINSGTALDRILDWMDSLYGYLSSPTGGGVRHGLDLREGIIISLNEARLFCNLIRSYLGFLLDEHKRLTADSNC